MRTRRKLMTPGRALAVALAAAGGTIVAPSAAHADEPPGCEIRAQIGPGPDSVAGFGIRSGCVQRRNLHVLLREDISHDPDVTLAERRVEGVVNTVVPVIWSCSPGYVNKRLYTEIRTSAGGKEQSPRYGPFYC